MKKFIYPVEKDIPLTIVVWDSSEYYIARSKNIQDIFIRGSEDTLVSPQLVKNTFSIASSKFVINVPENIKLILKYTGNEPANIEFLKEDPLMDYSILI